MTTDKQTSMTASCHPFGLDAWHAFLAPQVLPIREDTRQALHQHLSASDASLQSLTPIIRQDGALCLHLISQANLLSPNPLTEITRVALAVSSLGLTRLLALLDELPTQPLHLEEPTALQYQGAIQNSHHAASLAAELSQFSQPAVLSEYRLAAFFYGIGYWYLWQFAPQAIAQIQARIQQEGVSPTLAEHDLLGCTVQQLSARLVEHHQLSRLAEQALKHDTSPDSAILERLHQRALGYTGFSAEEHRELKHLVQSHVLPVKLANWLALSAPLGWNQPRLLNLVEIIADYLRRPADDAHAWLHRCCAQASREYSLPGLMPAAARLLLLPGPPATPARPGSLTGTGCGAPPATAAEAAGYRNRALYRHCVDQLTSTAAPLSNEGLFGLLCEGLHQGLGCTRVACFQRDAGQQLILTHSAGVDREDPLGAFTQNLQIPSIFKQLYRQNRAIWAGPHNQQNVWPLLPLRFRESCDPQGFLLQPLVGANGTEAVVYVDRHGASPLNSFYLRHARNLISLAGLALGRQSHKE